MIRKHRSTIKLELHLVIVAIICLVFAPLAAAANRAEEYVIGTVSKISPDAVTVKTAEGQFIEVSFNDQTTCLREKRPIHRSNIHAGDTIIIRALKVKNRLIANSIEDRPRNNSGYT